MKWVRINVDSVSEKDIFSVSVENRWFYFIYLYLFLFFHFSQRTKMLTSVINKLCIQIAKKNNRINNKECKFVNNKSASLSHAIHITELNRIFLLSLSK